MTSFGIALFLHVLLVASWFGGVSVMAMVLRDAVRSGDIDKMNDTLGRVQRWNMTMYLPVSILALATGVYLLIQRMGGGETPLYLLVKERLGSLLVLLYIVFVAYLGKKWLKQAREAKDSGQTASILKRYIQVLNLSLLVMTVLIFFVTVKLV
ncbi:hypothetical protein [Staphylospora marina]|uniref:hypothetical protein n=1 Tax=Staphylospora marina TaxID=2490858 RepID=UPI000F5B8DA7|nr:hypothetical protein [Staphylospora marina]